MTNRSRSAADRLKSLQTATSVANMTIHAMRVVYEGLGGLKVPCTISEYCRTQVFEFPQVTFRPTGEVPHMPLYSSSSVRAHVTSNLVDYFENSTSSKHYGIDPNLRHAVAETNVEVKARPKDTPVFIVVEEIEQLTPVAMTKGECSILDEILVRDGEKVPLIPGAREGKKFIVAWRALDGAWPELPNNQQTVNMVLAAVRVGQETHSPIPKHLDLDCLVTDDERCVGMMRPTASAAEGSVVKVTDTADLIGRVSEIADAIIDMEQDIGTPYLAFLVNSMYSDERKDDGYKRLQYLQLWQAMADTARKVLDFKGNVGKSKQIVAGTHRLKDLKAYRNDIAHWWADTIDDNCLADLQRTINELIRRKYFKPLAK